MITRRMALWLAAITTVALVALFAVNFYAALRAKTDPDADPGVIFERQNRPRYSSVSETAPA